MALNESPAGGVGDSDAGIEERVLGEDLEQFKAFLGDNWDLILQEHNIYHFKVDLVEITQEEDSKLGSRTPSMHVRYWKSKDSDLKRHKSAVFTRYNGSMVLLREVEKDTPNVDLPDYGNIEGRVYAVWDYDISQRFVDKDGNASLKEIAEPKSFFKGSLHQKLGDASRYGQSIIYYHDVEYDQVPEIGTPEEIEKNPTDRNRFRIVGGKNEYMFDYSGLEHQHLLGFKGLHDETRGTIKKQLETGFIDKVTAARLYGLIEVNEHFLMSAIDRYATHKVPAEASVDKIIYALENLNPSEPCLVPA